VIRTLPAGLQAELDKHFSPQIAVHLLDLELHDGTRHYWSSHEIVAPRRLPNDAAAQQYKGWLAEPFPTFNFTRSLRSDYGEIRVQNVSGNTIDREVDALMRANAWRGAYAVYRRFYVPADAASFEVHGFVADRGDLGQASIWIRLVQLLNPARVRAYDYKQTRNCHFLFTSGACGYRRGEVFVPLTTADIFSASTIGNSGLAEVTDMHIQRVVMILEGTGAGQERIITGNTGTTVTVAPNWSTNPDGTSKFLLTGAGTMLVGATVADIFSATTIGKTGSGWSTDQFKGRHAVVIAKTGAVQRRKITGNDATTLTVSPAWDTPPDGTSIFIVVYEDCPLDYASCGDRGVQERFPGLIQLTSEVTNAVMG